jgi:acetyl-CoA synthetase
MTTLVDSTNELLAERAGPPERVWELAASRLLRHPDAGLNTAIEACDRWAEDPNRLAVIVRHSADEPGQRWTFAEMKRSSSRLARALHAMGVGPASRVAALLPQGIEAYLTALAAWRLGAVFIPLYPGFGSAGLAQRLGHGRPGVVVTDEASMAALLEASEMIDLRAQTIGVNAATSGPPDVPDFWTLVEENPEWTEVADTAASDTATLLYTSGTTGAPKGCQLPHSYLLTMQPFVRHCYMLRPGDVFASTSSPGWVNGLYSTGFCVSAEGIPRVIYTGRFDARTWLRILEQEGVTYFSSAPSALREIMPMVEEVGFPSSLRGGASAGEHQGAELSRLWARYCDSPLQETYGTTEIGLVMGTPGYPGAARDMGALPDVVPGFEVILVDEDGEPTTASTGMIAVRNVGFHGCTGYLEDEAKWAERWHGDWYLTGDMARRDEKGQLWFQGRDDDLIVTSGYNVGPAEVEAVLIKHPSVRDVAVVGAPDAKRGSVVRAVVIPEPAQDHDRAELAQELKDLVRRQLGRHAYPRIVEFADALPRSAAGKVQRRLLRA